MLHCYVRGETFSRCLQLIPCFVWDYSGKYLAVFLAPPEPCFVSHKIEDTGEGSLLFEDFLACAFCGSSTSLLNLVMIPVLKAKSRGGRSH